MGSLREVVNSGWFARSHLLLMIVSGVALVFAPGYAVWMPLLLLLLPPTVQALAGEAPFRVTGFDGLVLVFLATTWVGYWASYDPPGALTKAWLITASVFLLYALKRQPEENLIWITGGLFAIGVGVSFYFLFTHDFLEAPRKVDALNQIGKMWMSVRPRLPWLAIHPNYVSGVAALTGIFGLFPLQRSSRDRLLRTMILAGFFVILVTLVMATSRGVWMALGCVAGIGSVWRLFFHGGVNFRRGREAWFPILVFLVLALVTLFLYLGPARFSSTLAGSSDYGNGSRAELFSRSLYFVSDYPFTGAGFGAFPGLYSEYMLGIPYFYVINSHNLFLDVFIEQGIFGGAAFFLMYLGCLWQVSRALVQDAPPAQMFFRWLVLSALVIGIVHGLVDDYLYNARGSVLSLLLVGLSQLAVRGAEPRQPAKVAPARRWYTPVLLVILTAAVVMNFRSICSMWYANLGAVELSRVQLEGFPERGWQGPAIVPKLAPAESALLSALAFDPVNRTANHRLGLIAMFRRDFSSAAGYLAAAQQGAPAHRGIIKSLGFSYAWLGDMDNAVSFLKEIPETEKELDAYYSWWKEQGRDDLSERVVQVYQALELVQVQP